MDLVEHQTNTAKVQMNAKTVVDEQSAQGCDEEKKMGSKSVLFAQHQRLVVPVRR